MLRKLTWWAAAAALVIGTASGVACGGGGGSDNTPAAQATSTKAAASPTSAAAASPTSGATQTSGTPAASGTTELSLVASNLLFDKSELKAAPGTIKIVVDNQDGGVPHNIHVFKGEDASGESVGMTDLTAGPSKETLTLNLAAGDYFYHCDAHPATMAGKLDVE
jgi:plastocyanin